MPDNANERALGTWLTILLLSLHVKYRLTERFTTRLFYLLQIFLTVVGRFSSFCATIHYCIVPTCKLHQGYKHRNIEIRKEHFRHYVVCRRCLQVYYLRECIEHSGTNRKSKSCSYKGLERHVCGTVLLKTVEFSTGKCLFIPHLSYCYIDLITSLQFLLASSSFVKTVNFGGREPMWMVR